MACKSDLGKRLLNGESEHVYSYRMTRDNHMNRKVYNKKHIVIANTLNHFRDIRP